MWRFQIVSVLALFTVATPSRAGVVVDHPPLNTGGPASDTEFLNMFGQPRFQRLADNATLGAEGALIRRVTWWGFYDQDNPPVTETMRVRFYGNNAGLPDDNNILLEESFLNPSRIATGRIVFTGVDPDEYVYQVDLSAPLGLAANTPFWLEIVQIGDIDTAFRWEVSTSQEDGFVFINQATNGWQPTTPTIMADMAFELSTIPEPATAALFVLGWLLLGKRRSGREG